MDIGGFVLFFLGVIVAFALLPAIANGVDTISSSRTAVNTTVTLSSVGVPVDIPNAQILIGTATITNTTTNTDLTGNVSIATGYSDTNGKVVQVTLDGAGMVSGANYTDKDVLVSMEYGADGYGENTGTRAMANLILIMSALAVLGYSVYYGVGKMQGKF